MWNLLKYQQLSQALPLALWLQDVQSGLTPSCIPSAWPCCSTTHVYVPDRELICIQNNLISLKFRFTTYLYSPWVGSAGSGFSCQREAGSRSAEVQAGPAPASWWSSGNGVKPRAQLHCGDLTIGVWCRLFDLPHNVSWVQWVLQLEQDISGLLHC